MLSGLIGCSSQHFGYSSAEWNALTSDERAEVVERLENLLEDDSEEQREKDFQNRPLNVNFGTRSNVY